MENTPKRLKKTKLFGLSKWFNKMNSPNSKIYSEISKNDLSMPLETAINNNETPLDEALLANDLDDINIEFEVLDLDAGVRIPLSQLPKLVSLDLLFPSSSSNDAYNNEDSSPVRVSTPTHMRTNSSPNTLSSFWGMRSLRVSPFSPGSPGLETIAEEPTSSTRINTSKSWH